MPTAVTAFEERVRSALTQQIAERDHAPINGELASSLHCPLKEIEDAPSALHSTHSLLLHPHEIKPWIVHPFAPYPASCWVQVGLQGYWATCLYCALGIAAALKADADIVTRFGGESEQCFIQVRGQDIVEKDLVFHLSTPIREWWDNVIHSCASFQPFRHEN